MDKELTKIVRTACPAHCGVDTCGILAHVDNGRIVKLEPADYPDPKVRRICLRGLLGLETTYHKDRVKYPMKRVGERGEGKFERISWDEALDTIAARFRDIADQYDSNAIGWAIGGPGGGSTKFGAYMRLASLTRGTRISMWGVGAGGFPVGSYALFGTLLPIEFFKEWNDPKLVIVWGSNPGEATPMGIMRKIMDAKENGAQVVVIDPRFTITASKADEHLGIKPGTDAALALGMMNVIFERNLQDVDFICRRTVGPFLVRTDTGAFLRKNLPDDPKHPGDYVVWDTNSNSAKTSRELQICPALMGTYCVDGIECKPSFQLLVDLAKDYPPSKVAEITGVSEQQIESFAVKMATTRPVGIVTHMGFTRTYHGDISIRAMGTLAAVTGNIRLTSMAGHQPYEFNWKPFLSPRKPGYSRLPVLELYDAVVTGKPHPIKAVWFALTNFLNQCADSNKIIREVFPNIDFIVVADLFMTDTARYADILLPACSYLEFSDVLLPANIPYVQLQQKVIEPLYESKSDIHIASALARKLGLGEYFDKTEEEFIDLMLDSGHPSMEGISVATLKEGPIELRQPQVLTGDEDVKLSTPSGKIEIYVERLREHGQALPIYMQPPETSAESASGKYPLTFLQGHSRFRHHSCFANVSPLLKRNPEPVVDMNPVDAKQRNISQGDVVTVFNDRGRCTLKARITEEVGPGVVNICQGWWSGQFKEGGGVNALTSSVINPVHQELFEPIMSFYDSAVEVVSAGEATE